MIPQVDESGEGSVVNTPDSLRVVSNLLRVRNIFVTFLTRYWTILLLLEFQWNSSFILEISGQFSLVMVYLSLIRLIFWLWPHFSAISYQIGLESVSFELQWNLLAYLEKLVFCDEQWSLHASCRVLVKWIISSSHGQTVAGKSKGDLAPVMAWGFPPCCNRCIIKSPWY